MKKNEKEKEKTYRRRERTIEDDFYFIGKILLPAIAAAAIVCRLRPQFMQSRLIPPCLFHQITGCYCPGCGGTRAVRALLRGQFLRSFCYHPLVLYGTGIYLYFMATQAVERCSHGSVPIGMRYRNRYVWAAAAIVLINFIVKNVFIMAGD